MFRCWISLMATLGPNDRSWSCLLKLKAYVHTYRKALFNVQFLISHAKYTTQLGILATFTVQAAFLLILAWSQFWTLKVSQFFYVVNYPLQGEYELSINFDFHREDWLLFLMFPLHKPQSPEPKWGWKCQYTFLFFKLFLGRIQVQNWKYTYFYNILEHLLEIQLWSDTVSPKTYLCQYPSKITFQNWYPVLPIHFDSHP